MQPFVKTFMGGGGGGGGGGIICNINSACTILHNPIESYDVNVYHIAQGKISAHQTGRGRRGGERE